MAVGVGVPPANAFWSLTVYGTNGIIVSNSGNTSYGDNDYSLSSMQIANVLGVNNGTKAFSILLSSTAPSDPGLMPFWLPTPAGQDYEVIMRIYDPAGAAAQASILVSSTAANYYLVPANTPVPEPETLGLATAAVATRRGIDVATRESTFHGSMTTGISSTRPGLQPSLGNTVAMAVRSASHSLFTAARPSLARRRRQATARTLPS